MSSTACWTEPGGFPFPRKPDKSTASRRDRPEPSAPSFSFATRPAKVAKSRSEKYFAGRKSAEPHARHQVSQKFYVLLQQVAQTSGRAVSSPAKAAAMRALGDHPLSPCSRRAVAQRQISRYSGNFCQGGAGEKFLSEQAVRVAVFGKSVYNRINTAIRRGEAWACSNSSVVQAGSPLP